MKKINEVSKMRSQRHFGPVTPFFMVRPFGICFLLNDFMTLKRDPRIWVVHNKE